MVGGKLKIVKRTALGVLYDILLDTIAYPGVSYVY
jgi:hypothetical protein